MDAPLKPPFYVISDTHFGHDNIVKYCRRPYDHEAMMIKRWSRLIKTSDSILHLGDVFFGGQDGFVRFRDEIAPKLTGRKYLILGNHDRKKWDYEALGFEVIQPFQCRYRNYIVSFDHYPKLLSPNDKRIHVHGHVHNHGYSHGEQERWGNINVSVEAIDYRPHRVSALLNHEIFKRTGKARFYNSRHVRWQRRDKQRRAH